VRGQIEAWVKGHSDRVFVDPLRLDRGKPIGDVKFQANGASLSLQFVQRGLAKTVGTANQSFRQAQSTAKSKHLGIWAKSASVDWVAIAGNGTRTEVVVRVLRAHNIAVLVGNSFATGVSVERANVEKAHAILRRAGIQEWDLYR
jgi:hypothetical protein